MSQSEINHLFELKENKEEVMNHFIQNKRLKAWGV